VVTAYVAESAASAPPPRGLPLSTHAPSRHSTASAGTRSSPVAPSSETGGGDDWDEAAAPVSQSSGEGDGEGPPLEELEAQMHGDVVSQGTAPARRVHHRSSAGADEDADDGRDSSRPLPELYDLVARLPAEVRETLDELFRARFVSVKKLPRRAFSHAAKNK
jgi:hypothetical protein